MKNIQKAIAGENGSAIAQVGQHYMKLLRVLQKQHAMSGNYEQLLLPSQEAYSIEDYAIAKRLKLS